MSRAYLAHVAATKSQRTLTLYAVRLQRLLDWRPKLTASDLTRSLLMTWHGHLLQSGSGGWSNNGGGVSVVTANNYVRTVGGMWSHCWDYSDELGWEGLILQPRRPELPKERPAPVVAPTWAEMDTIVGSLGRVQAYQRVALWLRCTGMRIGAAVHLRWSHVDLERARLTIPGEITKGGYGGRVIPMAPVLVAEAAGWGRRSGWLFELPEGDRARLRNEEKQEPRVRRAIRAAWKRSGVRREVYHGHPCHAFRQGFLTELTRAGVQREVTEHLEGRGVSGSRSRYLDDVALWPAMVRAVALVPPLGGAEVIQLEARRRARSE